MWFSPDSNDQEAELISFAMRILVHLHRVSVVIAPWSLNRNPHGTRTQQVTTTSEQTTDGGSVANKTGPKE